MPVQFWPRAPNCSKTLKRLLCGEVPEWLNGQVSKTLGLLCGHASSNLALTAENNLVGQRAIICGFVKVSMQMYNLASRVIFLWIKIG
jgi:hypothetical protein